jgi:hypothetical protein
MERQRRDPESSSSRGFQIPASRDDVCIHAVSIGITKVE